ncbi:chaplin family protein [Streptomyces sp. NPDC052773]|uniref:chaplin family protein n=1 Tax=Streptomyces sp. NPDC052773 TaxID=3365693 RepID=UPI0037D7D601
MRRVTRNGVFAVAAASGAMALTMPAHADSTAEGAAAGSPGAISGNTVQPPVHVPVNVCGNTVNVVGLLNPAAGNTCVNEGGDGKDSSGGGATAESVTQDSPGVISGNGVQLPVDLPVNVSGNTVDVVGIGNPVTGNESVNTPGGGPKNPVEPERPGNPNTPGKPDVPVKPQPETGTPPVEAEPEPAHAPQAEQPPAPSVLADTGTDAILPAAAGAAALVLGGAALRRRFRPGESH